MSPEGFVPSGLSYLGLRLRYETAYFTRLEYGDAKAVVDQVRFAGILKSAS